MESENKGRVIASVQCRPCPLKGTITLQEWMEWRAAEDEWMRKEMERQMSRHLERLAKIEEAVIRAVENGVVGNA
jgi:hypothetical protein